MRILLDGSDRDLQGTSVVYRGVENLEIDRNLYFNVGAPREPARVLERLRAVGYEKNGAYTDPGFVDWEKGDFRLRPDSPAFAMGIKSLDVREAGLSEDFPWPEYVARDREVEG
jgi:hypothetical protein